ncbi:Os11g0141800, partial [Oryza sativa Japonica Group]
VSLSSLSSRSLLSLPPFSPAHYRRLAGGGGSGDRALPSARSGPSGGRGGGGRELEGSPWLQLPGGRTGGGGDTLPSTRSGRRGGSGASAPPDPAGRGVNDDRRGGSSKWRGSRAVAATTSPLPDLAGGEVMAAAEPSPLPNPARSR